MSGCRVRKFSIQGRRAIAPVLFFAALLFTPLHAKASTCVVRSQDGNDPPRVFEARRQMSALAPENRGGMARVLNIDWKI